MDYLAYKGWCNIFLAGVNSTIGNLLLKKSTDFVSLSSWSFIPLNTWFISGLFFYGINVLLFAKALQTLNVSAAYPVLAGVSFICLSFASWGLFNEKLSSLQYLGMALILLGIYFLTMESN
jgi:multidrug transporter EmrE-like cation transporter